MRLATPLGPRLLKWLAYAVLTTVVLAGALVSFTRTRAGQDELRRLVVWQAGRLLNGTLEVGSFSGSIFGGVELRDVRVVRDGVPAIEIERLQIGYRLRELTANGATRIRSLTLTRPRVHATRTGAGAWNLATLVRRDPSRSPGNGDRSVTVDRIAIVDGDLRFGEALLIGSVRVPTTITSLQSSLGLQYAHSIWTFSLADTRFRGTAPDLDASQVDGTIEVGDSGWRFDALHVATRASEFTLSGRVDQTTQPSTLDLRMAARQATFQEWSGLLSGLSNLAVVSSFEATMQGPPSALQTHVVLRSDGGDISTDVVLDSTVPGWHARGTASVARLNLARWLNRPERPSDITGVATLDVDLQLGGHFPVGPFAFKGSHVRYLDYRADDVDTSGRLSPTDVLLDRTTATAYGANVRFESGRVGIDAPYAYHLMGTANGLDLRRVPRDLPVPHVESSLVLDYDVTGRLADSVLTGRATFGDSVFLGADVRAGTTGEVDTDVVPFRYAAEGRIDHVDLNRFGRELEMAWLADAKYDGTLRGTFHVRGTGSDLATMTLDGGGHLDSASLFRGTLSDAEVEVAIGRGSMTARFDGQLARVDSALVMGDPFYDARLSGHARGSMTVRDLLVRTPEVDDYTLDAVAELGPSVVRGIPVTTGSVAASMSNSVMRVDRLELSGPSLDATASGMLALDGVRESRLDYRVTRADLPGLRDTLGRDVAGVLATTGVLTGTALTPHVTGEASVAALGLSGVTATTTRGSYDVAWPADTPLALSGHMAAALAGVATSGPVADRVELDVVREAGRLVVRSSAALTTGESVAATLDGDVDLERGHLRVDAATLNARGTAWQLDAPAAVSWTATATSVDAVRLSDAATRQQHVTVSGTWDVSGPTGGMRVQTRGVLVEPLTKTAQGASLYGGVLESDLVVSPTSSQPRVAGTFAIAAGRVRRLQYERFAGHVEYQGDLAQLDVRLDQAPGVWLTATGSVPASALDRAAAAQPLRLVVKSSPVSLGLLEGVTDLVRNVDGQMQLDVTVQGTTRDPHFSGRVDLRGASFDVVSSGARYRNGRLGLALGSDRVTVEALHIEDELGHPLDVTGSLGTHELRVGDLQVAVSARNFQVLRNEFGRVQVDARLNLGGEFESPRLAGDVTVSGGSLNVDRIFDRALFQPYATEQTTLPMLDPIVAINPWERMGLDIELHVPGTLRMVGENVQVSPGTPLGLGDISLRAFGDLYLYKDPGQPMYVTGSFDSLTGTYAFQGRRFDLDPISSITFRGDLNPELYVTVNRLISGVDTRVSIVGALEQPELRLASTPPLDASDILSLIVFNTSTNELSALQQQQLAIRAGTLAAGFIAAPMVSALERTLGIDTLEIEPGADIRGGARVTVGNEIAPGLVARFSRQFGEADYDEATLEYYLSRILRIRATFSDAGTLSARSPFRRVERAGIDLLLFFSF